MLKYLTSGLGAVLLLSNLGWYIFYDAQGDKLVAEQTAHQTTISNYELAQEQAKAEELQKALDQERKDAENARKANEAYNDLLGKYNDSILRYKAAQRAASTINMSSTTTATDGDYSVSDSTTISITIADAQICAVNTARIQAAHQWFKDVYGQNK